MSKWIPILLGVLMLQACFTHKKALVYNTPTLEVDRLTKHTYVHRSYLVDNKWGKVGCNGLVYVSGGEAVVFDTPADDSASMQLIDWIKQHTGARVKAVVVNHFHGDCLGGLRAFHDAGITSYSNELTRTLARGDTANKPVAPQKGFEAMLELKIGGKKVLNSYHGAAHTQDNIVSYVSQDRVLFGGCMIKAIGAGRGNLNDADTSMWGYTVMYVRNCYPKAKYVVPGHGAYGGRELLKYTMNMFPMREGVENLQPSVHEGKR